MRDFLIGAAAVALAASAAVADPGKGQGGGKGNQGGGQAAAGPANPGGGADKARGNGKGNGGGQARKAERGGGQIAKAERGNPGRGDKAERSVQRAEKAERRAERGNGRSEIVRDVRNDRRVDREVRVIDRDDRFDDDDVRVVRDGRGLFEGCPPGLAKKNNGCMPPGLAKKQGDWRSAAAYRPDWFGYSSLGDGRYFYDDGYLYRLNNTGAVSGFVPLLGGALSVGNPWPSFYDPTPVPDYYVEYYGLGAPDTYRYADDVLYRVDPQSDAITSIVALLTGDQFAVGQPLPMGYDVYNVPYQYRDRYVDGPDAYYRYSDGYVYEVDPTTQLIQTAIELLV